MRIMIMGMDGYLGWPLSMYLSARGHEVSGVDNFTRRRIVKEIGSWSATPIKPIEQRIKTYEKVSGKKVTFYSGDLTHSDFTDLVIKRERPETIVHLGEIPSAPYSMIDVEHCNFVQTNNVIGNNNILFAMHNHVPGCHLLKLGTMGEYGTPNVDIPEGFFEIEYRGRKDRLPFPKQPGSWYHLTKAHDTNNIIFACKIWGLRSTDIMQGVVHGIVTDDMVDDDLLTRYDFDEAFGTALNRFCAQAVIGHELTPYGKGGQTRGYIALRDSMQCLTLAAENPPDEGEYRVFNQFEECYSVNDLAEHVVKIAGESGIEVKIWNIENPRIEAEEHYYNPDRELLPKLGFRPTNTLDDELRMTIPKLTQYKERIEVKRDRIMPTIRWKN
ncbi:MAG: NAD-dependent epimerase/dehydratase family protein [Candidatus Bathyarchaeota archaeon]|nr:MAG: NAD-dependent epimerase/dehydratase family protein [Candidatus Bathyarchaeota archaeon]